MDVDIVCTGLDFPEGPVALPDGSVVVVEIGRGCLTRVYPDGHKRVVATPGGGPNGAAVGPDGLLYVCNNGGAKMLRTAQGTRIVGAADDYAGGRIERIDIRSGKVDVLYTHCDGFRLSSPNDLVFDRSGGFYFSDIGKPRDRDRDKGGLYYALPDGSGVREVSYPLGTPNGVGLSADETELFVAETETARLWRYRIVAPGVIDRQPHPSPNGASFVYGAGGFQRFDSLKLDASGTVCVATLVQGGITAISPDGVSAEHIPLPDSDLTNLCFGGPDLRMVYVTMANTGRLGRLPWPRPGLPLNFNDLALID